MQFIAQVETRHRPDVVLLIARVAHLQRRHGVDEFAGERVGNVSFEDEAFRRGAHLAAVLIATGDGGLHRLIQVGIVEHDKGIGATQLKHAFLQRRPRLGANRLAGADAAGDGHRRDAVIIDDLRNAVIGGVHPTEHAIRQAGGGKNLAQQAGAAHHVRGMLQQVAVAGQQDRHRAAQHLPDREVPRHDRQNGAQRTILNHRLVIFHLGGFRRQHRRAVLGVPVAEVGGFRHLAARLSDRLAHLEGDHLGHLFPAGAQRGPDAAQRISALGERRLTPLAIACRGESDSRIDLAFAGPGQRGDHLTGSRVDGNRVRCR